MIKQSKQRGETIVEVLIAMAVIASALGGVFAIASRSRNTMQMNTERYQAQLYANEQAAFLRSYATVSDANRADVQGANFCIDQAAGVLAVHSNSPNQAAECEKNSLYKVNVSNVDTATKYNTFDITVTWDSLTSNEQEKVELYYGT
jgi:type II secretory pathway pseudopilin PulG